MNSKSSPERLADAVLQACHHWRTWPRVGAADPEEPLPPPPITVAISREAGADAGLVAARLGERLGWPVYDRALLERIAAEMGLRTSLLESVDERRMNWLRECIEGFGEGFACAPAVSASAYVRHLIEMVLSLAAHGECVIVGRAAPQILPATTTLRVRLVAPLPHRIMVIRQRLGLSPREAARWIEATDRERGQFVRDHFGKDPADPHGYDLVLNTGRLSVGGCAEVIEETLHRFRADSQAVPGPRSPTAVAAGSR